MKSEGGWVGVCSCEDRQVQEKYKEEGVYLWPYVREGRRKEEQRRVKEGRKEGEKMQL